MRIHHFSATPLIVLFFLLRTGSALAVEPTADPVPSWNDSPATKAIVQFVRAVTDKASKQYVPPAEREWAYDRKSPIGTLDKALDEAQQRGWTVVSMKNDWKRIYPFEKK